MEYFVEKGSIVREIWGKADTVLFIFAGASSEFALNKAVDWLYYTGRLPADPLGRLFSTVTYARQIVFLEKEAANKAIDQITAIHSGVEKSRGSTIPDWAYRDVLYMLIHYSIAAFEVMERKVTGDEKQQVFDVFFRFGNRMGLKDLPPDYKQWTLSRNEHLEQDLAKSPYTTDLYRQYKKHLGPLRYWILLEAQKLVVPQKVKELLHLATVSMLAPLLFVYKLSRRIKFDGVIKNLIMPSKYRDQIKELDIKLS